MKRTHSTRIRGLLIPMVLLLVLMVAFVVLPSVLAEEPAAMQNAPFHSRDDELGDESQGPSAIDAPRYEIGVHHSAAGWMNAHPPT